VNFAEVRQEIEKKLHAPILADPTAPPDEWGQSAEDEAMFAQLGNIPIN
jgi:hypothetical protein